MPLYKAPNRNSTAVEAEKPLPEPSMPEATTSQRPGTSGTEMVLVTNRLAASKTFQEAQRAERAYKAKKRTTAARANCAEAKQHFSEVASHLKAALGLTFSVVGSTPYLFSHKLEQRRKKADESRRKKALEKRRKLEERLAREQVEGDDEEAPVEEVSQKKKTTA